MRFAAIQYLWVFWLVLGLLVFYIITSIRRRQKTGMIISSGLWSQIIPELKNSRRSLKIALVLLGVLFICLALIRPQWGYQLKEFKRKGVDIFVLVDTSDSMLAEDVMPNRMKRAKREVIDLVTSLHGDRIGLIPFAGLSYIACPLTTDYDAFRLFIDQLDTDLIPVQGTDISGALKLALKSFEPGKSRSKAIIVITDGEATQGDIGEVVDELIEEEIRLFVIGMGNEKGAPIPLRGGDGFKADKEGKMVISKLNELSLQKLALRTGGTYVRSVTGDSDLEQIYFKGIKEVLEANELKNEKKIVPEERFQIPLIIAILMLGLEPFVFEVRRRVIG